MDGSFNNHHLYAGEQEDSDKTPESPAPSTGFNTESKLSLTAVAKKGSRRGIKKKVVSVPIKGESQSNTGSTTPPSDSWAWRKYGQKPIKGSPYPRAYYRCSSSKGCPARKQVERSRLDPTMLVITYSCEHNHAGPISRNNNHHHSASASASAASKPSSPDTVQVQPEPKPEEKFVDVGDESLITGDEFSWFGEMETTSSTVLESSIFTEGSALGDSSDVAMLFPMGDDDESLFADLGELPECSVVFRHGGGRGLPLEEQPAQRRITPLCGTTT